MIIHRFVIPHHWLWTTRINHMSKRNMPPTSESVMRFSGTVHLDSRLNERRKRSIWLGFALTFECEVIFIIGWVFYYLFTKFKSGNWGLETHPFTNQMIIREIVLKREKHDATDKQVNVFHRLYVLTWLHLFNEKTFWRTRVRKNSRLLIPYMYSGIVPRWVPIVSHSSGPQYSDWWRAAAAHQYKAWSQTYLWSQN